MTQLKKENAVALATQAMFKHYEKVRKTYHRLNYHIMAPTNWINDPNGLIHFKGEYHVFYQFHPYSAEWGPMHWGHVTSKDLVNWKYKPVALAPDQDYETGCFSGSAIGVEDKLILFYTAHHDDHHPKETQCMAYSIDAGITFTKSKINPIIREVPDAATEDLRDPKVWKYKNRWYLLLGTAKEGKGKAIIYKSADLEKWEYIGVVAESNGEQGDLWECPDLFSLGDKYVLMTYPINLKSFSNMYIIGEFDYKTCKLIQENYYKIDCGDDFYAGQSFLDDKERRIVIGWMDMWKTKMPTQKDGWAGALTLPRCLTLKNNRVYAQPVEETQKLRTEFLIDTAFILTETMDNPIAYLEGDSIEIQLTAEFSEAAKELILVVRANLDQKEKTVITYNRGTQEMIVDKTLSGVVDKGINKAWLSLQGNTLDIHLFVDTSSIELFLNEGEMVMTNRIYPSKKSTAYGLYTRGGEVTIKTFKAWRLKNIYQ